MVVHGTWCRWIRFTQAACRLWRQSCRNFATSEWLLQCGNSSPNELSFLWIYVNLSTFCKAVLKAQKNWVFTGKTMLSWWSVAVQFWTSNIVWISLKNGGFSNSLVTFSRVIAYQSKKQGHEECSQVCDSTGAVWEVKGLWKMQNLQKI